MTTLRITASSSLNHSTYENLRFCWTISRKICPTMKLIEKAIFLFLLRSLTFREKSFKSVWTQHMMILERISLLSASSREKAFISENAPSASPPLHTRLPKYIISIVSFSSCYRSTILQQPWPTFANLGHYSLMLDKSKNGNFRKPVWRIWHYGNGITARIILWPCNLVKISLKKYYKTRSRSKISVKSTV